MAYPAGHYKKIKFEVITTKVETFVVDGYSDEQIYDLENDDHVKSLWLSDYNRGTFNKNEIRSSNHQEINFIEVVA
jgi:hypothetical protein|tara:strand:- start:1557 stop:1784 length:228 start_codon:yes stop_codon:yes gene_type:complete